jgi:hypothetical protein
LEKAKTVHMKKERRCQNPVCRRPITIIPSHHRRQYCHDACKQATHCARLEAGRIATEEAAHLARIEQERADLLKRWGAKLPETIGPFHSLYTLFSVDRTCVHQDKGMAVSELQEVAYLDLDGFDCTSRKGDR